jgi:broad specificity phosphatase PhoE
MTGLILIRHGRTHWNDQKRIQGREDVPLTNRGRLDMKRLAAALSPRESVAVYSSPVERAYESAKVLADDRGYHVITAPALTEWDVGEWVGKTGSDLAGTTEWAHYMGNPSTFSPPGGEAISSLSCRVTSAIDFIVETHNNETVLIVTHGDCIRVAICHYIGLPLNDMHTLQIDLSSFTELNVEAQHAKLIGLNHSFGSSEDSGD